LSDDPAAPPPPPRQDNARVSPGQRLGDDLVMGLRFFSRLPTGDRPHQRPDLARMVLAAPFTTLVIGLLPALLLLALAALGVPGYFAAALAVAALVLVTGAMAEDAIADAADGLFGGTTIERRLEIMKDSRHGSYGVAALSLYLLLRVTGLGALAVVPLEAAALWLATMVLGRSGALWLSAALPPARSGGASASAGRVGRRGFAVGAAFAAGVTFVLAAPFVGIIGLVAALLAALVTALLWETLCRRLIGGQTGDLIGALQALIEVMALTMFLIFA
jgi:adenosylcobinamide-GDP ribazoletransferase